MQANLRSSPVNLAALREHGQVRAVDICCCCCSALCVRLKPKRCSRQNELVDILDKVRGKKVLVIDAQFTGPLGLVAGARPVDRRVFFFCLCRRRLSLCVFAATFFHRCRLATKGVSLLKEHGVEKIHHLLDQDLITDSKNVLYLVRPKVENMKMVARQVRALRQSGAKKDFTLVRCASLKRCALAALNLLFDRACATTIVLCAATHDDLRTRARGRRRVRKHHDRRIPGTLAAVSFAAHSSNAAHTQLDLIPLEDDVMTLALSSAYKECFLEVCFYVCRRCVLTKTLWRRAIERRCSTLRDRCARQASRL